MRRIPVDLALLALRQSGYHVRPGTLRAWAHRGHITRTTDGYDLGEIEQYLRTRHGRGVRRAAA